MPRSTPGLVAARKRWILRIAPALAAAACAALGALGCGDRPAPPPKLLFVGVDGADWRVIRKLWSQGRLPALRSLADRGSTATLHTAYGPSPVIWTTVVTGLRPDEHGIVDFVVPTEKGDLPVSSTLRKAPALWNMVPQAGGRVAALGWWGSWPAENLPRSVVLTDRALFDLEDWASPPEFAARLRAAIQAADEAGDFAEYRRDREAEARDRAVSVAARDLVRERPPYDLVMAYYRSVDITSHRSWKYWEPEKFADLAIDPAELAERSGDVPGAYAAFDAALGRVIEAGGGLDRLNVLVVSDHGFRAAAHEELQISLNFDRVLERLGWLERSREAVDFSKTRVYTVASAGHHLVKKVRFAQRGREPGGTVELADRADLRRRLARDLERVTWRGGRPMFRVRDAKASEVEAGADFCVVVDLEGATETLEVDGKPWPQNLFHLSAISGTHGPRTHGILLAAGPDIASGADLGKITIHDIPPTILYALGLPYGRDFAGRPNPDLFRPEFRARTPLRTVTSWGRRDATGPTESAADQHLVEELRALGYLD